MLMQAKNDDLTNLPARESFLNYLQEGLEKHRTAEKAGALAFVDLDNFKLFNDREGHLMGDELLKQVGEILGTNSRPGDLIGRYGGDEFILFLPSTNAETALILLEEIRRLVAEMEFSLSIGDRLMKTRVTLSMGVAAFPRDADNVTDLLRKGDEALYRAKNEGRNRVCLSVREERMKSKTNFYSSYQLERLSIIASETKKSESFLLREALDDLIKKYADIREKGDTLLEFQMGRGLLDLVDPSKGGPLLQEIVRIRKDIEHEKGFILPGVRCRDNRDLSPLEYLIIVRGREVARETLKKLDEKTKDRIAKHMKEVFIEHSSVL
jgi:diguanylate cyclase